MTFLEESIQEGETHRPKIIKTCGYDDKHPVLWTWISPSALESRRLGVKSWLWRIFSTTSSASTRVSSILFSWDSMESCFTRCLRGERHNRHFVANNGFHCKIKMPFYQTASTFHLAPRRKETTSYFSRVEFSRCGGGGPEHQRVVFTRRHEARSLTLYCPTRRPPGLSWSLWGE